jgi:hypothetical protein
MESVLDRYFRDQLKRQQLDILSNEEACKGLVGKYVIYTDKIYYIQRGKKSDSIACEKRLVDGEDFTKLNINFKFNVELTTSQALSIPDGKKKEAVKLKR